MKRLALHRPESNANPDGRGRHPKDKREGAPHSSDAIAPRCLLSDRRLPLKATLCLGRSLLVRLLTLKQYALTTRFVACEVFSNR